MLSVSKVPCRVVIATDNSVAHQDVQRRTPTMSGDGIDPATPHLGNDSFEWRAVKLSPPPPPQSREDALG